jgi:hypothetical protein
MMRARPIALLAAVAFAAPVVRAQPWTAANARQAVAPAVEPALRGFPLGAVRLLDGPFLDAMRRDAAYILSLDPDRLLSGFYSESGLEPKALPYGGWETEGLGGHTLGHWMSAAAMFVAATGDSTARARLAYVVDELAGIQRANGDGYASAIPGGPALWARIRAGEIEASGFRLNGVWAPWYTMHKQLAGLLDAYWHAGLDPALEVARGLAEWAIRTTAGLDDAAWQRMLACEHGGMNEALAELYALTGDARYLELSRRFHHDAVLGPMARRVPNLQGLHGNTQIPKVIGLARQYDLIGDDSLRTVAEFFWEQVVLDHTYAIGGNTMGEHFGEPGKLSGRLDAKTAETCNTYNMLRLTRHLFTLEPRARYADFYERALYNHILASQDPETGMFAYFMSLRPGHFKTYSTPEESFWCCVGSGMENHVRYGESIWFESADTLYVALFVHSELDWERQGIRITQETRFPDEPVTRLAVAADRPTAFALRIRHPSWAAGPLEVELNGEPVDARSAPGSFLEVDRTWLHGDTLTVRFPMALRAEAMPDDPSRIAILYGPIVLAGSLGTQGLPEGGAYAASDTRYVDEPVPAVPVLATGSANPRDWIRPLAGDPLTFHTVGVGRPYDVVLRPFFRTHHERYTVYWDLRPPDRAPEDGR